MILRKLSSIFISRCFIRRAVTIPSKFCDRVNISAEKGCDGEELNAVKSRISGNLLVSDNFISEEEETMLYDEVRALLEKRSYQNEHWDDAIHGYRESEKESWSKSCMIVFKRVKEASFDSSHTLLPYVHILDLDSKGFIKPHIDSVKFCGSTIAGLSLLSPSIMRFRHEKFNRVTIDALLPRRSLYICRNAIRYEFTHEILPPELSIWNGDIIGRCRRISLMLRCKPEENSVKAT
ncbi:alpha-ketoglutarate-dependent dioxygenase alkB homolog 7, mitochondrial-like [Dendronephthya gigantea]|uniref:alpha-ketoglutarate-dependent dioxygenase alkB homolog 7, mitochondrial-like n=1 Tax=Dendronephthya gigantea TaxID=151771 RepID=UPI0010696A15|nr:alpha-ketoglutarate-dependent dioxygenase alkB homolog 7, mitochondrial-like [Dendronephthya gigantea]